MRKRGLVEDLNKRDILRKLRRRFVNEFLDLIILDRVESASYTNGYAIIEYIFQKFNILVSSGSVYSTLYAMEREGLIVGAWSGRKRVYHITPAGKRVIRIIREQIDLITSLFREIITQKRESNTLSAIKQLQFSSQNISINDR